MAACLRWCSIPVEFYYYYYYYFILHSKVVLHVILLKETIWLQQMFPYANINVLFTYP